MYDVANMIGCLGMEDPQTLKKDIIKLFLEKIKNENIFQELSWSYLFDLILAIRFSWLAEWLRKNDKEMIELEIIYMNLLLDNKNYLKKFWK
jgi:homoserine kinase type II